MSSSSAANGDSPAVVTLEAGDTLLEPTLSRTTMVRTTAATTLPIASIGRQLTCHQRGRDADVALTAACTRRLKCSQNSGDGSGGSGAEETLVRSPCISLSSR